MTTFTLGRVVLATSVALCGGCAAEHGNGETRGGFVDITRESGVTFVHEPAVEGRYWLPESIGSGVVVFDFDGDGVLDLYFLNGAWRDSNDRSAPPENEVYRQYASGRFERVRATGLEDSGYGQTAAVGDYDNDGDLDVYVGNVGVDALYRNDGEGRFSNVTGTSGITNTAWTTAVTFVDVDLDGWLDIFVGIYVHLDLSITCADAAGRRFYCPQYRYDGVPDMIYRNNGDGTFTDVTARAGLGTAAGRTLGVVAADFTGDGYPDIYVANDADPNHLWVNRRDGTFDDAAPAMGAAVNEFGTPEASMGVAIGDVANDGDLDLFLTHLQNESNTLYERDGATFADKSFELGLAAPSLASTGFGTAFIDYDHDTDLDLLITNGRVFPGVLRVPTDSPGYWDPFAEPNMVFENVDGTRFRDVSARFADFTGSAATSRALAVADLDGDGDLDFVETTIGGPPKIFRNDAARGHWLSVRVHDPALRREVPGTVVDVVAQGRTLRRFAHRTSSFFAGHDGAAHFGLADLTRVDELRVTWPGGVRERFQGVPVDRSVVLERGRGAPVRD